MNRLAVFLGIFISLPALADDSAGGLDVRTLPPIPDVSIEGGGDDSGSSIAVLAATLAGEDTVVGAAKREQSLGTVASAVTVVSGDRLRRFGYRSVSEALRSVAGLYVTDDRMSERIGIRGIQILGDFNTRILVLIDGATVAEPWNQFVGIGNDLPVNIDDIDRIEIVRGPVSSVYGTNAFLGIINIVTRGADKSKGYYGRIGVGDFGKVSSSAGFAVGDVNRQVRGSVFFQNRTGETLDFPEFGAQSKVTADGEDAFNASLVGHYDGAFLQVRAYRKLRQLAAAPYGANINDSDNHNIDEQLMVEGGYSREVGDWELTARLYFNKYMFSDLLAYAPDPAFTDHGDSTWAGAEVRGHWKILPHERLGLTVGAEATLDFVESNSYNVDGSGTPAHVPSNFNIEGVYAEMNANATDWATVSAGLRFDRNSDFENKFSPRLALLFHDGDDFGLKLLYAQGFRNPSPVEAFFKDNMSIDANPDLLPETIQSFEAVLWARPLPGLNVRLSGFRWNLDDILELGDSTVVLPGDTMPDGRLQYHNENTITSTGAEIEASYRDTSGWYAFASATYSKVDYRKASDDTMEIATNAPEWDASGGVSTPKIAGLFHLSTEFQFIGARHNRDGSPDSPSNLHWNFVLYLPAWHHWDLTLGVRNILDDREQIPAQVDYDRGDPSNPSTYVPVYTIPGEGREFYARLGYSY
jgi:iron complex outermembrane receptor protein